MEKEINALGDEAPPRLTYGDPDPVTSRILAYLPLVILAGIAIWAVCFCIEFSPEARRAEVAKKVQKIVVAAVERNEDIVISSNGKVVIVDVQDGKFAVNGQLTTAKDIEEMIQSGWRVIGKSTGRR